VGEKYSPSLTELILSAKIKGYEFAYTVQTLCVDNKLELLYRNVSLGMYIPMCEH
jgi:hypothetical protein